MKPVVSVRGVSKRFGKHVVLRDLELELPPGTTTVLLGANGAGKSTLLRLLLGLERADVGSIEVAGFDPLLEAVEVRRRVGYVPDAADAYGWMTARELFAFLRPQYPRWDVELEARLVERLAIPLKTRFAAMSRGEATKSMLVTALAPRPDVYLIDEAFSGLDPRARDEVLGAFLAEMELEGRAALVVTHELDVAARLADRVAVLDQGRIAICTDIAELCADEGVAARRKLEELFVVERSVVA